MLLGNDVIDLESEAAVILVKLAVFAAGLRPMPDDSSKFVVHEIKRRDRDF